MSNLNRSGKKSHEWKHVNNELELAFLFKCIYKYKLQVINEMLW